MFSSCKINDSVLPGKLKPTQSFPFIILVHLLHWKFLVAAAFKQISLSCSCLYVHGGSQPAVSCGGHM